jgi:hypothetical protein
MKLSAIVKHAKGSLLSEIHGSSTEGRNGGLDKIGGCP